MLLTGVLILSLAGCTAGQSDSDVSLETAVTEAIIEGTAVTKASIEEIADVTEATNTSAITSSDAAYSEQSLIEVSEMFSNRDLEQAADLSDATMLEMTSNEDILIEEEGVYVISGSVTNTSIVIDADDEAKVQLVLDGVTITNEATPAIYVKSADKVFVTTSKSDNLLEVTGNFTSDGDTNLDAVIFSKSDLVLNGLGVLTVISNEGNGITSKDDLKVTGGTYNITSLKDGLEANDSIRIYDGTFSIVSDKDALHSENEDDLTLGYIYIQNGSFEITASDDAIRGTSVVQIDGGSINIITSAEGIEGTYILINGGTIDIYATDDGINATALSDYDVTIDVNGGDIYIEMASGDTDGFDANGDIYINGGSIEVTAVSSFDADGTALLNAGTVVVNGEQVTELPASQMGKGKR